MYGICHANVSLATPSWESFKSPAWCLAHMPASIFFLFIRPICVIAVLVFRIYWKLHENTHSCWENAQLSSRVAESKGMRWWCSQEGAALPHRWKNSVVSRNPPGFSWSTLSQESPTDTRERQSSLDKHSPGSKFALGSFLCSAGAILVSEPSFEWRRKVKHLYQLHLWTLNLHFWKNSGN